ncbi:beta-ketoacyl synthase chain length factor [Geothrix oryzisoli]|uniref:beta-ketoacyl synthase chain length factor n=1 Tax=Geothrix oryzisoli TaxID=2922721 RepID=UPI001FACF5CA|nr:beta-ketoacyl synthase chain length factor [Geothrix oryzisoli]
MPHTFKIPLLRASVWSQEGGREASTSFLDRASGPPDVAFLDPLIRRRLSPLGRAMLHCAQRAAGDQGPLPSVFSSRHGEAGRSLPVLEDLAQGLPPSPTQFSMNVHNASAGIWSIARRDPSPSLSLAAGLESFAWGLVEAQAIHAAAPETPVLLVHGDAPLPPLWASFDANPLPLHALALLIGLPAIHHLILTWSPEARPAVADGPWEGPCALDFEAPGGPWATADGTWAWRVE